MDVDEAARELYALPPGEFTARRTALAKQAKADGDAAASKDIAALRRPTASAHAVNLLAADEDDDLLALLDLGHELRAAQAALDAARMAELAKQRRTLLATVARAATGVADGAPLSAAGVREVEETLTAAVASADAADAVASGRLTRALQYAGFGDVDLTDATATPPTPRAPRAGTARKAGKAGKAAPTAEAPPAADAPRSRSHLRVVPDLPVEDAADRRRRLAAEKRAEAEAAVSAAQEAVDAASSVQTEAQARADELAERVTRLQAELAAARSEAVEATRAVQQADRRRSSADVAVLNARRALKKLPPPPS